MDDSRTIGVRSVDPCAVLICAVPTCAVPASAVPTLRTAAEFLAESS